MRYLRAGRAGERSRTLEPLGVVLKAGAWYLVARVRPGPTATPSRGSTAPDTTPDTTPDTHAIRIYRVSRILTLETLDERFERPDGFDLAADWRAWSEEFEARMYHGEATVRFSPRARELLPYYLSPAVTRAIEQTASTPDVDGRIHAVIPIESHQHAIGELLRLGAEAKVVAPGELRERMAATVSALAQRYAQG